MSDKVSGFEVTPLGNYHLEDVSKSEVTTPGWRRRRSAAPPTPWHRSDDEEVGACSTGSGSSRSGCCSRSRWSSASPIVVFFMVHLLPGNPALTHPRADRDPRAGRGAEHAARAGQAAVEPVPALPRATWSTATSARASPTSGRCPSWSLDAVPITLSLLAYALVLSLVISVPLAALAATAPGRVRATSASGPSPCSARACRSSGSASCSSCCSR